MSQPQKTFYNVLRGIDFNPPPLITILTHTDFSPESHLQQSQISKFSRGETLIYVRGSTILIINKVTLYKE